MRIVRRVGHVGPAGVGFAVIEALLQLGVGDDSREEIERARDFFGIWSVVAPQHDFVQVDDGPANLGIGLGGGAGQDVGFDRRKQAALGGLLSKVAQGVLAGDVVGQDALNRAHRPARISGALRHFLRVDAAVEDCQLVVELAPALTEDRVHLSLDLLRAEELPGEQVVEEQLEGREALNEASRKLADVLYAQASAQAQSQAPGNGDAPVEDEVVEDADYEVIDEEEAKTS